MQNVGEKERQQIQARLEKVKSGMRLTAATDDSPQTSSHKAQLLGLALMTLVGPGVLKGAVEGLKDEIKRANGAGVADNRGTAQAAAASTVETTRDVLLEALNRGSDAAPKKPAKKASKATNGKSAST